jgi:hypothetical protein
VVALLGAVLPLSAWADEAEPLYDTDSVAVIDLGLSSSAEAELDAEPFEYVEGSFELGIDDDGVPGGHVTPLTDSPLTVGIRLKGSAQGSFRSLDGKAAFKVKFKEFGGPKFLGLKKMTLNNMVEDPSMVHEALTYTVFRDLGVPAPRTGNAFVRVNGQPYGVYLDIEDVDDVALERIFGAFDDETQHLYEGEYHDDVVPGGAAGFEVDEGDEADIGDLEALIAAVNATGPPAFPARLAAVADVEEMTLMWAIEKYVGRWDGYAGRAGENQPNNYFLYSDPDGRFQMLPWGSDETWEEKLDFEGNAGLMFNLCLEDADCFAQYWHALRSAREAIAALPLDSLAEEVATLLEPWQEIDPRKGESQAQIAAAVAGARQFMADRPGEVDSWVAAHEPPVEERPVEEPAAESPSGNGTATLMPLLETAPVAAAAAAPAASRGLDVARIVKHRGQLRLRTQLSAPGRAQAWASIQTSEGRRRACAADVGTDTAGTVVLPCRFSNLIRDRLQRRWLRMRIVIRFTPLGGTPEVTVLQVRVPRQ